MALSGMPPATRWPHGVRAKYVSGCRCDFCRKANLIYHRHRTTAIAAGFGNPLVPAAQARAYLQLLREHSVGSRAVHLKSGVSRTIIVKINNGQRVQIRRRTEQRILSVTTDDQLPHAVVKGDLAWNYVGGLLSEGWTKSGIAKALGLQSPALQIRRSYVTAYNEQKLRELWRRFLATRYRLP